MRRMLSRKSIKVLIVFLTAFSFFMVLMSFDKEIQTPSQKTIAAINTQLQILADYTKDSLMPLTQKPFNEKALQNAFLQTRRYYKSVEWAAEYFAYATAKTINGAPKIEAEIAGQTITQPHGLQLIESYLFPHMDKHHLSDLKSEVEILQTNIFYLRRYFSSMEISDWQIWDAAKLEVFRMETLGITGFDNPLTLRSMEESAIALDAVKTALAFYPQSDTLIVLADHGLAYLDQHKDFNTFDRAVFIRQFANPLTTTIEKGIRERNFLVYQYNRLLRQDAFTLFDSNAFNSAAYSPYLDQKNIPEKIALGSKLFYDPKLSGTALRSCASCHLPEKAFANNKILETAIDGKGFIDRNTPTLLNTAFQPQQFYDQRAPNIEDQVKDVIHNPKEMNGSLENAVNVVTQSAAYQTLYKAAFPTNQTVEKDAITEAIAAYVRSLVGLNSRFDLYMRGDNRALDDTEVKGFNLFMGKAQCATCHYMPLFSGVFPPKYITQDTEILGVPAKPKGKKIDADKGLYNSLLHQEMYSPSQIKPFENAFKTVSVRNVSKTAPYMHNGVFATLEEVMDFYNQGGGIGQGIKVTNQSLSDSKLDLTPTEIDQLIAFMKALDSQ